MTLPKTLSPLDPSRQTLVAYAAMDGLNPLSFETLDRVLSAARLAPGTRTLDLGCGNAVVSRHLAERHGLAVDALERSPAMCAMARERLTGFAGPGSVTVRQGASADVLPTQPSWPLIVALGVSGVVPGPPDPPRVLAELRPHVEDGGWLLWGDPFLRREPSAPFRAVMGGAGAYLSNAENVTAGETAGFRCWCAAASTEQDWDAYQWAIVLAVERWLAANLDHPDAPAVQMRARMMHTAYLMEGRDVLGFGLYLFRAV